MRYLILGYDDRLRFWDLLDDLRIKPERFAKICAAIRTPVRFKFYLPIWFGIWSCYANVPGLLTRLPLIILILIFFAIAITS